MNVSIVSHLLNEVEPEHFNVQTDQAFAKPIQNDQELYFHLESFCKVAPGQLQKIDELYYYEKLEVGDLLEKVVEGPTRLTIEEIKEMVKTLAKYSFFKEEAYTLHKVCQGHFNELVRERQPFRSQEHVEKVEQKILKAWQQKEEIKPNSIQIKKVVARNLLLTRRFCNFYISYKHVDNYLDCLSPYVKKWSIQDFSFATVIEKFENKIQSCNLNGNLEWSKLAGRIFGSNLIILR